MALIKSISGIRGTIGGSPGEGLTPLDVVKFSSAFAAWVQQSGGRTGGKVVVGRDARTSGEMVRHLVCGTLTGMGLDVADLGLATTPTVELAVEMEQALGGIIITASHNPGQWNALKLLDADGEFLSADDGQRILDLAEAGQFSYAPAERVGRFFTLEDYAEKHIRRIMDLDLVDPAAIRGAALKIVVDCVNSVGGTILPSLLRQLGVKEVVELHCTPDGLFPHNPEPLPENLLDLSSAVREQGADAGLAVDPDVDRLAIVDERGEMFGEEYTLVAVSDYVLGKTPGNTVSNLSSTRALREVTEKHGGKYYASAVGEVNVVHSMKKYGAVIGGEGNGGVIYPPMHYGRDALTGTALFLSHLALAGIPVSRLRGQYPRYVISKNKINIDPAVSYDHLLEKVATHYEGFELNREDGLKVDLPAGWVHLRKSNTEPIIRIYSEAPNAVEAEALAQEVMELIRGD